MTLQKEKGDGLSDNRVVRVISTASDATSVISVQRTVKTGEKISVPCSQSIEDYNRFMGGVDRGDQLRGYYRCPTKVHKFYMYIYFILKDICITNSYILYRQYSPTNALKTLLSFRHELAKKLIGDYCSKKSKTPLKSLGIAHFPLHHQDVRRGRCHLCYQKNKRKDTAWFCLQCEKWFCHTGNPSSDCFGIRTCN